MLYFMRTAEVAGGEETKCHLVRTSGSSRVNRKITYADVSYYYLGTPEHNTFSKMCGKVERSLTVVDCDDEQSVIDVVGRGGWRKELYSLR